MTGTRFIGGVALVAAAFLVSLAAGYTLWKMQDAGVVFGADSPVNPGIYERAYDVRHFDSLPRLMPASSQADADEDFSALLAAAVGWDVPKLDMVDWAEKDAPGAVQDVEIEHRSPPHQDQGPVPRGAGGQGETVRRDSGVRDDGAFRL
ncbi:MAG TPA: hypothetical protein DCP05_03885 [Rhodospirillaceae bacterium]|jgi:hypothetical protein|nr:hypothetical protein [Alphaproteobacteria bacterium]MDP6781133.1 hypothetical protein [Alphaproteobacteria bacterium]HAQ33226.1 hypothetical protein [Rhodospirillaceae bacterium]|tara:strand:+ start:1562 stop:2008 length:447 start_codon:yes stop_codon:yes gene_type:complete